MDASLNLESSQRYKRAQELEHVRASLKIERAACIHNKQTFKDEIDRLDKANKILFKAKKGLIAIVDTLFLDSLNLRDENVALRNSVKERLEKRAEIGEELIWLRRVTEEQKRELEIWKARAEDSEKSVFAVRMQVEQREQELTEQREAVHNLQRSLHAREEDVKELTESLASRTRDLDAVRERLRVAGETDGIKTKALQRTTRQALDAEDKVAILTRRLGSAWDRRREEAEEAWKFRTRLEEAALAREGRMDTLEARLSKREAELGKLKCSSVSTERRLRELIDDHETSIDVQAAEIMGLERQNDELRSRLLCNGEEGTFVEVEDVVEEAFGVDDVESVDGEEVECVEVEEAGGVEVAAEDAEAQEEAEEDLVICTDHLRLQMPRSDLLKETSNREWEDIDEFADHDEGDLGGEDWSKEL